MGESGSFQISDQRGKHEPSNKTTEEIRTAIRNHIEPFPKIESHFTRKDCKEKYDWDPVKDKIYRTNF